MDTTSYLGNIDSKALEVLYEQYKKEPNSVDISWKKFFEGFDFARKNYEEEEVSTETTEKIQKEFKVLSLINGYRSRGHLFTKTNPVRERRKYLPTLDIENFELSEQDLDTFFSSGKEIGLGKASLREIIAHLEATYCRSIGIEYKFIRIPKVTKWIEEKIEETRSERKFSKEEKIEVFENLNKAVLFEKFIHRKFVGQKRFSLEGGESLIPALSYLVKKGARAGIKEFVMGMAHRGRLNILANILKKNYDQIFNEFYGRDYVDPFFSGDVKYHLGFSTQLDVENDKTVMFHLAPNPSHLEAVGPVISGISRARIDQNHEKDSSKLLPIIIHGDAAIAGQGIVYELVQMARVDAYQTGGTVHIVINNQVGFTTNYIDGRSSTYCTDVAKVTLSPVIHVNGDDIEAVIYAIEFALEFRQKYKRDVFIDLLCYRKYGHNEADEPMFTQPRLYEKISKHPNPCEIYSQNLIEQGVLTEKDVQLAEKEFTSHLEKELNEAQQQTNASVKPLLTDEWEGINTVSERDVFKRVNTRFSHKKLLEIADKITTLPEDISFFSKTKKLINTRKKLVEKNKLDWAMCELLAYGSLLQEGFPVRMSGQDVERGTFAHRHAVLIATETSDDIQKTRKERYIPLNNIEENQKNTLEIYNSTLSEYAVMGFEFGYALTKPNTLTLWEAQFGDFANGAQIIFDQFISTSEVKWNQRNGMVVLLPHGYEGQGAEHSNARMERFLTLCSKKNMKIANCTTPANFYHLLRAQLKADFRKPCVVFTPKSLLRHSECVSTMEDLSKGEFQPLIDDPRIVDKKKVRRVLVCTGKFYYDLDKYRQENKITDVAIIRLEQIYPLYVERIREMILSYSESKGTFWTQEEPMNYGALDFILRNFRVRYDIKIEFLSRPPSAVSATGSMERHKIEHLKVIKKSFGK